MGIFDALKRSASAASEAASAAQAAAGSSTAASEATTATDAVDDQVREALIEELSGPGGGLAGLLDKIHAGGLGHIADSWVGKGENLGISAEQAKGLLAPEKLQALSSKLGLSTDAVAEKLAAVLPGIIDKLTPDGLVPDPEAVAEKLTGFLKGKL